MSKQKPRKPVVLAFAFNQLYALRAIAKFTFEHFRRLQGCYKFARDRLYSLRAGISLALMTLAITGVFLLTATPLTASAATNNTINFQARLESASGAIVPDGNYNVEFKLYNAATLGTAEWTEDYTYNSGPGATDARIHVANGYLTVNLGSITAFPTTINWDQQQWLTMNIGGTSGTSVTWDGEMNPRLTLTAVPYAFIAGQLATGNGTFSSTLSLIQPTAGNQIFQLPDMVASGTNTYTLLTNATGVQLQSSTPGTAQTGYFNISGTGLLGTLDATGSTLNIGTGNASTINIGTNAAAHTVAIANGAAVQTITVGSTNSTSSLLLQAGTGNLQIQTQGGTLGIGNNAVKQTLTIGNTTGATTLNLKAGTGGINIGNTGTAAPVQIGNTTSTTTQNIFIGDNATASSTNNVTLGSLIGNSATLIQGGTGLSALDLESNGGFITIAGNSTSQFVDIGSTGSGTNIVNIGNTSAAVTIESGSSNNYLENNSPIFGTVVQSISNNSIDAFQVQNASSGVILNTDTTANTVTVNGEVLASTVGAPGSAPTVAVNATAGNLNSTYYYTITFVTATGETEYGPVSAGVSPANQQVNLSSIPTGPTGIVTKRGIYRTKAGGSNTGPFYRVAYLNDNSTTTYTDNVADGSLSSSTAPQANTTAYFSNADDQSQSEVFGAGAIASNVQAVAVGNGAEAHYHGVAIGYNASNSYSSGGVAVGANASTNWDSVAVGSSAVSSQHSVAIGQTSSANNNYSIALGEGATTNASNQLVIGGSTSDGAYVQNAFIGSGITDATPQNITLNATGGSGANITGASLSLAGGIGTGTGNGGGINFEVAKPSVTSGSTSNTLSTVASISGVNGSALFQNSADSTSAFQIQNANGYDVFSLSTTAGTIILGTSSHVNASLVFNNSGNTNTVTLNSGATSSTYTLTLPTTGPSTSQCLQTDATTASQLVFGSCGSGGSATTLQQAYNASAGASPSIKLTNTLGAVTIQNDDAAGSPIAGNLFAVRDKNNSGTLFSVANTAVTTIRTGNSTNNYDTSGAFQIQNHSGNNIFSVDTSGNQVVLGKASTIGGTLDFKTAGAGDITLNTASTASAYTLTLPTTGPSTSQCLLSGASTASQLTFGSCGSAPSTTLQQAYNNSNTAAPTITLNNASNPALIVQNTNTSPINGTLFGVNANAASGLGTSLFSVQNTGAITQKTTTNTTTAYQLQNSSTSALFTADTTNMRLDVDATYALMSAPTGLTVSAATNGGSLTASSTYRYKVTAIDSAGGETTASSEASGTTTATSLTLPLNWTAVTGANGYKIYRTAAGGASGSEVYLTTVLVNNYTDNGSLVTGSGSAPSSNTAYVSTNTSNANLQLSVGGNGTPTGQLYVSGTVPTAALATYTQPNGGKYYAVYVQGRYAYTAGSYSSANLQIFDVSNPASPVPIGGVSLGGALSDVYVQGRYAYAVSNVAGTFKVIDVSNPSTPTVVGSVSGFTSPTSVYVQGRYAYIVDQSADFTYIYDVSNPAAPQAVTSLSDGTSPQTVVVQGRYAYIAVAGAPAFEIWDLATDTQAVNWAVAAIRPLSLYVQGRYLYVVGQTGGLYIYDITNPTTPLLTGSISTGSSLYDISVQGRYAYGVNSDTNTLQIFDVSNPANPVSLGTTPTSSGPQSVFVEGRYAYVASATTGTLQVFDLGGTYTQQLEAGSIESSTLQTDGNANIGGDLALQGGLSVGQSSNINGALSVTGGINTSETIALTTNGTSTTGNMLNASRTVTANIAGNSVTAPTFDAKTNYNTSGSQAQTQSFTTTVNNHSNRFMMVWVETGFYIPTHVTYNSVQMTNVAQINTNSGNLVWSLWVLTNPTVGTTLSVSVTQNPNQIGFVDAIASSWYNVSQSNPWQYLTTSSGASGQSSITATSASGQLVVDSFIKYTTTSGDSSAAGSGQTKVSSFTDATDGAIQAGESYKTSSGSTTSMSWTGQQSAQWAEAAIGLNGAPASTASVTGAVASISSNCSSTTANACVDSGNVLSVTQSDASASGSVVDIQNASSAPALQVQSTSGTTVMSVYTMGAQTAALVGDGVLNLGEIDGVSLTSTGTLNTVGGDYAEYFYQVTPGSLVSGDVACLNNNGSAYLCDGAPNTSIVGVVSTKASVVGNAAIHNKANPGATALVGMLGQLQTKVSTANGPIEPGDMLTMSATPGVAVKAIAPGMTIGSAMQSYSGTGVGEILTYVHVGYFDPTASNGAYIQDGGALTVMSLNVSGNTTLTNLTVTGSATFTTLTVQTLTVGHIVSSGTTPSIITDNPAGTGASVTVSGTDTSGKIVIDTGTGTTTGDLSDLTFAQDFESVPTVVLTAGDVNAAKLQLYVAPSDNGFSINAATTNDLLDNQTYTFYYHVIQ